MDNFIDLAMRTASSAFYGDKISKEVFLSYLDQMIVVGEDLDQIKKALFYGKEPTQFAERWDPSDPPVEVNQEDIDILHGILGVITESAELAQALAKRLRGEPFDLPNIHEESGDVKWYLAMLARARGDSWDSDEVMVIEKLRTRYPDKFTDEAAKNRNLHLERAVIERSRKA